MHICQSVNPFLEQFLYVESWLITSIWYFSNTVNSRLADTLLLRTPTITDKIQIPIHRCLTENDPQYYGLSLFWTQKSILKVSAITRVDCTHNLWLISLQCHISGAVLHICHPVGTWTVHLIWHLVPCFRHPAKCHRMHLHRPNILSTFKWGLPLVVAFSNVWRVRLLFVVQFKGATSRYFKSFFDILNCCSSVRKPTNNMVC